jgi:hypothetical protein
VICASLAPLPTAYTPSLPSSRTRDAFCAASLWLGSPFYQPPIHPDRAVDVEYKVVVEAVRGPSWHFDLDHRCVSPAQGKGS